MARHNRREIELLLELRDREALTFAQLSEASGIPQGTLTHWSYKLRQERLREEGDGSGFEELEVVEDSSPTDGAPAVDERAQFAGLEIEVSHCIKIRLCRGFEEAELQRLLRLLTC